MIWDIGRILPGYFESLFTPRKREKIILPFHRKRKAEGLVNKRPKNVQRRKARRASRI